MRLYDIAQNIEVAINGGYVINEETGEIIYDASNLEELELDFNEKLEACAIYVKNKLAEAEAIKAEEKKLSDRRKTLERQAERLKNYIDICMNKIGENNLTTSKVALTYRKSSSVEVFDPLVLPENFCKVETKMTPDKVAIKNAIKAGKYVPGAKIVENNNLVVK